MRGVAPAGGGPFGGLREVWDRVIASDPGLVRARMAISAAVAMTTALVIEYGYASAIHAGQRGILVAMMLGGVVAMMGSMALTGTSAWPKVRTGVFFPVAFGAGMVPGALVAGHMDVMLAVFVAVMFVAVWARRFGPAFFFYGFMLWMGYFFAAFLDAKLGELPSLLEDVLVGTAVSILLSVTLLRTHPRRTLRRVQRAFGARARAVARASADLLTASGDPRRTARAHRRLHARELRLAEAALMIEAWTVEPGVLPRDWSGPELRRRLLAAQLAIDELAHAAIALAAHGGGNGGGGLGGGRRGGHGSEGPGGARRGGRGGEGASGRERSGRGDEGPGGGRRGDERGGGVAAELVYPAARVAGHLARREYPAVIYAAGQLLRAQKCGGADTDVTLAGAASDRGFSDACDFAGDRDFTGDRDFADARGVTGARDFVDVVGTTHTVDAAGSSHAIDAADAEVRRAFELLGAVALTIPAATGIAPAAAPPHVVGPQAAAVRLARAAVDYVRLASESADLTSAGPDDLPAELVPAATFTLGMLPGSASVAGDLRARGGRWNPLSRASLTTRQAVQVALAGALAIILGRQVSEVRYYWAVIATFVTFTGTATRSETSLKAVNRVLGTLAGLGVGIGLAEVTAGHTLLVLAVIVLAMTCGFYIVNLSYAAMIVFVTIMVSQLYSVLHEFTPGLLVLRLEETSLGAAIGIAVGLVVLPTSTRETVRAAQRAFLEASASVLEQTAAAWEGEASADPTASVRAMEDRLRRLALVARPLTRPLISGSDPALMRRRIALHAAVSRHVRTLAAMTPHPEHDSAFAQACRDLARIVTGLPPDGDAEEAAVRTRKSVRA